MTLNSILSFKNITKRFGNKTVLNNLSFDIFCGDFITLIGDSGSGKTTFLNIVGLIDKKFDGQIYTDGENVLSQKAFYNFRKNNIGYVFQSFYLLDYLTVKENILLPFTYSSEKPDLEYLENLYKILKLEDILNSKANVLSGGEKQRTAIARALAKKPKILLCDEPTGNLDVKNRNTVLDLLKVFNKTFKTTIIIVTHDEFIADSGLRKCKLANGGIYE